MALWVLKFYKTSKKYEIIVEFLQFLIFSMNYCGWNQCRKRRETSSCSKGALISFLIQLEHKISILKLKRHATYAWDFARYIITWSIGFAFSTRWAVKWVSCCFFINGRWIRIVRQYPSSTLNIIFKACIFTIWFNFSWFLNHFKCGNTLYLKPYVEDDQMHVCQCY